MADDELQRLLYLLKYEKYCRQDAEQGRRDAEEQTRHSDVYTHLFLGIVPALPKNSTQAVLIMLMPNSGPDRIRE
ncbi:hypothetical protein I7I50_06987 [Histoplasma capsulatum G186AR]|uniref:Uncharacterized protein n=1 Tax=Ajellomyces capsulatus TaxID=5037 RepID=A0A8H7Z047_AJECA|nr:hypothetical protein I7I52_09939 [Histoplasma capsulatum]QSS67801.1 hypothetical protein I7I50_06987 [Histoplasma capsulatum G186AR]